MGLGLEGIGVWLGLEGIGVGLRYRLMAMAGPYLDSRAGVGLG